MDSVIHASGFGETMEGKVPPMRISKIIDAITLKKDIRNYISIIQEIRTIVTKEYKFVNVYHINALTVEVLYYIHVFNNLSEIHESSVWTLSDLEERKKRDCSICKIG